MAYSSAQSRSGEYRGEGKGKGKGKGGQAGYGGLKEVTLGLPFAAHLPGTAAAKIPGTQAACDSTCLLCCAEAPTYVSVGRCGHASACWICALRLRALSVDRHCPVCKEELENVFITSDATVAYPSLQMLKRMPKDVWLGVYFESEAAHGAGMKLFEYRCRIQNCAASGTAFLSLNELENHIWYTHQRQFCRTCLHGKTSFVSEQVTYTTREYDLHCMAGGSRQDKVKGQLHPLCKFCNEPFFDSDALMFHMHHQHHLCHICDQMGWQNEFFYSVPFLAAHYKEGHYVCIHDDCVHDGHCLSAFADEDKLTMHRVEQHRGQLTEKEKKTSGRQTLQLGFLSYAEERTQRSGGGFSSASAARGLASDAESTVRSSAVRFSWPSVTPAGAYISNRWTHDTIVEKRYPNRQIIGDSFYVETREFALSVGHCLTTFDGTAPSDTSNVEPSQIVDKLVADLDPRLFDLQLHSTYAQSGNQKSLRCFIDALHAVLRVLCGDEHIAESRGGPFTKVVKTLTLANVDALENLRDDLVIGEKGGEFDWEPLEHVLALRPLFFRLLRTSGGASRSGRQNGIGPKLATLADPLETAWREWLLAAQSAVTSLGRKELLRLWVYTDLCIRWRDRMDQMAEHQVISKPEPVQPLLSKASGSAGPPPTVPAKDSTIFHKADFPTIADEADTPSLNLGHSPPPRAATVWGNNELRLSSSQCSGARPKASGLARAGHPASKGSRGRKANLSGVVLNGDQQPILCNDKDLVLLRKSSEEDMLAECRMNTKKAFSKKGCVKTDLEDCELAEAIAASLSSQQAEDVPSYAPSKSQASSVGGSRFEALGDQSSQVSKKPAQSSIATHVSQKSAVVAEESFPELPAGPARPLSSAAKAGAKAREAAIKKKAAPERKKGAQFSR